MGAPDDVSVGELDRTTYLGGGDAAAILGLSPFEGQTPLGCYFRKVGRPWGEEAPPVDMQRERIFKRGRRMEPVVIEMLRDEYPIEITKVSTPKEPNRYRDEEYPFMAAEIDFEWKVTKAMRAEFPKFANLPLGSIQNGEIKTTHPFAAGAWGEADTDEVPIYYATQAWHGLGVTCRQATLFGLLVGSDNLLTYQIMNDPDIVQPMRAKLAEFWNNHVLKKIPPPVVDMLDVYRMLRLKKNVELRADAELVGLVSKLAAASNQKAAAEAAVKEWQFQIGERVLAAGSMIDEGKDRGKPTNAARDIKHVVLSGATPILTIALQGRDSIDSKLLEEKYPGAKQECTKTSKFFVFRRSKNK